jgi:hypothetical protein
MSSIRLWHFEVGDEKEFIFNEGVTGPVCKWEMVIGAVFEGLGSREGVSLVKRCLVL